MLVTIVQSRIEEKNSQKLIDAYKSAIENSDLPKGLMQTYLIQDINQKEMWKIIGIWEDKDSFEKMRQSTTPKAILIFQQIGVEPETATFEIISHKAI
jgi:quinol monooxygenase YgiN